jgi:HEAT repeat protein
MIAMFCGATIAAAVGCADLDFLPYWMPFQPPPSDKVEGVVTPAERIAELRKLADNAGGGAEEKAKTSAKLAAAIRKEQDPLMRMEIVRALGRYPSPEADEVLKAALSDDDPAVRQAACEAWGRRADKTAIDLLGETLRGDVNIDVRLAAAKALGSTHNPAAMKPLAEALDDANPAMQYRAMLALREATGKDLGNDVARWQQYVKGELPEPKPSLAEQIRRQL